MGSYAFLMGDLNTKSINFPDIVKESTERTREKSWVDKTAGATETCGPLTEKNQQLLMEEL